MLRMSHPLVLVVAFSGLLFVNIVDLFRRQMAFSVREIIFLYLLMCYVCEPYFGTELIIKHRRVALNFPTWPSRR